MDRLEAALDRITLALEKFSSDHRFLWEWVDKKAAPVVRWARQDDAALGAEHELPRGLAPLYGRVGTLELDMGSLLYELQRTVEEVERLGALGRTAEEECSSAGPEEP